MTYMQDDRTATASVNRKLCLQLLMLGQIGAKNMTADEPSIALRQEHMTFQKKPKKNLTSIFQIRNFRLGDQGSTGTKARLVQMFE